MSDDKVLDELARMPLDQIPDNDAGAIEIRRRALEDALAAFNAYWPGVTLDVAAQLEALTVAIQEKAEREGIYVSPDGDFRAPTGDRPN